VRRVVVVVLALLFAAAAVADEITLQQVVGGLDHVTSIGSAGDERLFIVEQTGLVRLFDGQQLLDAPFADLRDAISCCGERGLLSIAFHPDYRDNGLVFIAYTDVIGRVTVMRYHVAADDPNRVDPDSATPILQILHINAGHNSGEIAFGPDGYLYVGIGDGDSTGDSDHNAQDLARYLGKILRIDVDHGDPYAIPESNPFAGRDDVFGEIWAYGFRNPWRFSFDRDNGDFWIADVGENSTEEIDLQLAGSPGGQNYGWPRMEGSFCYGGEFECTPAGLTPPVIEYGHDEGCAVIGGYRYRGAMNSALRGSYLYADYCTGTISAAAPDENGQWISRTIGKADDRVRTFGQDADGELYVAAEDGTLSMIVVSVPRIRAVRR